MSTETTAAVKSASTKAGEKAIAAVAAAAETLPTVVETAEVALEIPSKVVLNQKLVVLVTAGVATAVGVGAVLGWQRFQTHRANKKAAALVPDTIEDAVQA